MSLQLLEDLMESNVGIYTARKYLDDICKSDVYDENQKKELINRFYQLYDEKAKKAELISLIDYNLDDLVEYAKRIKLDPCELMNEEFQKEYREKSQQLLLQLYEKWRTDNPDKLKSAFNNISSVIKLDLLDGESLGY